jgi:membrane-associated protease RseP (regulator of RpoE activity)
MSDEISYSTPANYYEPIAVHVVPQPKTAYRLPAALFALTTLSTLFWGAYWMLLYETRGLGVDPLQFFRQVLARPELLWKGVGYSFAIMLILLSHEMGHYLACRYYQIRATLPFFLPAPIVGTGTFGAFIRIRSPFPDRKSLFDVGLAGPIAGFVVALPFIYLGLKWSVALPKGPNQVYLWDPLIFRLFPTHLANQDYMLHPIGFAAWFACLATSLNLLPIGQLDGGHVSYALFRNRAYYITWFFFGALFALSIYGFTRSSVAGFQWLFYCGLLLILRKIAGFRHPQTLNDENPIGFARKVWGVIAAIVFALTFMPVTIFS